jgi:hypothetical protein
MSDLLVKGKQISVSNISDQELILFRQGSCFQLSFKNKHQLILKLFNSVLYMSSSYVCMWFEFENKLAIAWLLDVIL